MKIGIVKIDSTFISQIMYIIALIMIIAIIIQFIRNIIKFIKNIFTKQINFEKRIKELEREVDNLKK